ncbi:hypothetical protein B0T14DRAFT_496363 [Immersiella caudata]|uniref:Uncharacterized protein n=1 Tax=Immersiella caudata TaxID=314043 RepID=A0AA39WQI9_9PEZI|nr:hypothetical protein B0T14DRAFT_496363 [Immersiella caudata]
MEESCTRPGDGDLYGIGIRVDFYLQWFAGFLLRIFSCSWSTISGVRVANNKLGSAVMLAVVINTAKGTALSVDYLIVYYFTVALFYNESYNLLEKTVIPLGQNSAEIVYRLNLDAPLVAQDTLYVSSTLFGA